jgi:hypothetical protein
MPCASTAASKPACGLAGAQPATITLRWVEPGQPPRPTQLDLVFRTERGTALNPNHASRGFAALARTVGLKAHPHLLRHALASAMAANKEPASIIAAQLRHADGGALAQRVYIHQLPQTAPPDRHPHRGRVRPRRQHRPPSPRNPKPNPALPRARSMSRQPPPDGTPLRHAARLPMPPAASSRAIPSRTPQGPRPPGAPGPAPSCKASTTLPGRPHL